MSWTVFKAKWAPGETIRFDFLHCLLISYDSYSRASPFLSRFVISDIHLLQLWLGLDYKLWLFHDLLSSTFECFELWWRGSKLWQYWGLTWKLWAANLLFWIPSYEKKLKLNAKFAAITSLRGMFLWKYWNWKNKILSHWMVPWCFAPWPAFVVIIFKFFTTECFWTSFS